MHNQTKVPCLRKLISLVILFCLSWQLAYATHIVGGELNYTHIEGDSYEISLTIFRDCYNANPNVFFDDTVSIGLYDPVFNFLVEDIRIPFDTLMNDTLSPVLYNDCLVIPPAVCVHTTLYKDTINLAASENGYVLVYQRCCRNGTINNIVTPLETGATFSVFISPKALEINNSSPKFQSWPPIYICADFPIYYDQSAIDQDMDSIAYKLCTPLKGGGPPPTGDPKPQPPEPPPYEAVEWFDPPFNESNMLNAFPGNPLKIDPLTGILSGTPNTIGQFVVGICIEEYRDDELISTIRRDFQYNVGLCGNPTASFFSPNIQCSNDPVEFTNESSNSDEFLWTFDLQNNPQITSSEFSPSYLYEDYGTYIVQLISEPFTICADTFTQEISILPPGMNPAIEYDILGCSDLFEINFNPIPNSFGSNPTDYTWVFSNGMTIFAESPTLFFPQNTGFLDVTLQITGSEGCVYEAETTLYLNEIEETLDADTLTICNGDTVFLNQSYSLDYDYFWTPIQGISNPYAPNPYVSPSSSNLYTVIIQDALGCEKTLSTFVQVIEFPTFELPDSLIICADTIELSAGPTPFNYFWSEAIDHQDTFAVDQNITVSTNEFPNVYIHSYGTQNSCDISQMISINNQEITQSQNIEDQLICPGDILTVNLNQYLSNYDTVIWNTSSALVLNQNDSTLEFLSLQEGWDTLSFALTNEYGCQLRDTFSVYLFNPGTFPNYTLQNCGTLNQNFYPAISDPSILTWNFGDDNELYEFGIGQTISHNYAEAGSYVASYWIESLSDCADTIYIPLEIEESISDYGLTYDFSSCEASLDITVDAIFESSEYTLDSINWIIDNQIISGSNLDLTIEEPTAIAATFFYDNGCVLSIEDFIDWQATQINQSDTIKLCEGESITIGIPTSNTQSVNWLSNNNFNGSLEDTITISIDEPTLFIAEISTQIGSSTCMVYDSVFVLPFESTNLNIGFENINCSEDIFSIMLDSSIIFTDLHWYNTDTTIWGSPEIQLEVNNNSPTIFLEALDPNGCPVIDSLMLASQILQSFDTTFTPCYPDITQYVFNTPDNYTSLWSSESAPYTISEDTISMPFATSSSYYLEYTDIWGCKDSLTVYIEGSDALLGLELLSGQDTVYSGSEVSVQSNLTNLDTYEFIYDNLVYLQEGYIFTFSPEEYTTISLLATDSKGCSATAEISITVLDPKCDFPYVFIPNTFTPNGDGDNDSFKVEGNFIEALTISIYDRWGERVFHTNNRDKYWDGTFKNQILDSDSYAYYIEVECIGGDRRIYQGNVSLIR